MFGGKPGMAIDRVVSDTSPLINLAGLHLLELLPSLYSTVLIPLQVAEEFGAKAQASDPDLSAFDWMSIVAPVRIDPELPKLGSGEAAALTLAKSEGVRYVLLDERKARGIAVECGLLPIGTLAVLRSAKDRGLIPQIRPYLAMMQAQGRRLSAPLIAQVLQDAGE